MTPTPPLPTRCTAEEIAAVLAATAQPQSRVVISRPLERVSCPVAITTDALWRIRLWRLGSGELQYVMAARSPDGRTWDHGCQRHWETTGEVVEPLGYLTTEQRVALRERLERAVSLPELDADPTLVVVSDPDRIRPKLRPMARGGRK